MADEVLKSSSSREDITKLHEKVVASSATPEKLFAERVYANRYLIQSRPSNTGPVYYTLDVAGTVKLPITGLANAAEGGRNFDLSKIYIAVDNNGDGVIVKYNSTGVQP